MTTHDLPDMDAKETPCVSKKDWAVEFTVPLVPVAQGRSKFTVRGKHVHVYDPTKSAEWKHTVATYAKLHIKNKQPGLFFFQHTPLFVSMIFYVPRPKNHHNKRGVPTKAWRAYPTSKPDLSNYLKGIEDALNGVVYDDDAQIVSEYQEKRYVADGVEPSVRVRVRIQI